MYTGTVPGAAGCIRTESIEVGCNGNERYFSKYVDMMLSIYSLIPQNCIDLFVCFIH